MGRPTYECSWKGAPAGWRWVGLLFKHFRGATPICLSRVMEFFHPRPLCQACDKARLLVYVSPFRVGKTQIFQADLSAAFSPQPEGRLQVTASYIPALSQPWAHRGGRKPWTGVVPDQQERSSPDDLAGCPAPTQPATCPPLSPLGPCLAPLISAPSPPSSSSSLSLSIPPFLPSLPSVPPTLPPFLTPISYLAPSLSLAEGTGKGPCGLKWLLLIILSFQGKHN